MKRIGSTLLFVLISVSVGWCAPIVVYSSYGPGMTTNTFWNLSAGGTALQPVASGIQFSPSATVRLSTVTGNWGGDTTPVTVSLWSDSGGLPGSEIESWSLAVTSVRADYALTSVTNPVLVAGTEYFLFLSGSVSHDLRLYWGFDDAGPQGYLWLGSSPETITSHSLNPHNLGAVQIDGIAVPEPETLLLLASGVVALGAVRRRLPRW